MPRIAFPLKREELMNQFTIVGLSGGLPSPSRTFSLVELVFEAVARASGKGGLGSQTRVIDVAALPGLGLLRSRGDAGAVEEGALGVVEQADLLIVGSPVYKGFYTELVDGRITAEPAQLRLERLVEDAIHAAEGRVRARHRLAWSAA